MDDDPEQATLTYKRLMEIDRHQRNGELPTDAVLLSSLMLGLIEEWAEGERDVAAAVEELLSDVSIRLAMPRRLRDRMRVIYTCQRRLRLGRLGSLPRREFFPDAAALFAVDAVAQDKALPDWVLMPPAADRDEPPRRRRRRRRR